MTPTQELADAAMKARGLTTYYGLSKALNTSHQRVTKWVSGERDADEDGAVALAMLAGLDPAPFVLKIAAGRTKTLTARRVLLSAAQRLAA